jgi:DNA-directed RNA polymerase specialized sigma subunit
MAQIEQDRYSEYDMNQRQVAEALGVTRTAIQQAERRAFKKIKKILNERGIKLEHLLG